MRLGTQRCKVFVNDVLQREAPLLHEYGDMKKMFHALNRSIPWPRQQIQHTTAAGMAAPNQVEEIGSKVAEGRGKANHKVPSPSIPKKKLQGQKRHELSLEDACITYVRACNKSCPNAAAVKFGKYHTVLRASDLRPLTFGPSHSDKMKYLTDRLMDARGQQMMDAHAKPAKEGSDNSFFIVGAILWEFLLTSPKEISNKEDYFNLAWDMTYNDLVFIPILVKQGSMEHWILFVVNNKKKEFQILDSLWDMSVYQEKMNDTKNIVKNLRSMLSNEGIDLWPTRQYHDIPQQSDGWSCGLYVLKYMELWNGTSLRNFTQDDIYNFRRSLPAELIFSKLNTLVNVKREIMVLHPRMKMSQV
uniref:Ubiquitin-like protease family profile domain-containing protein n=1 Tax=Arundo donax TaxID=35708 RepID=A0A0A9BSD4_ARUDO